MQLGVFNSPRKGLLHEDVGTPWNRIRIGPIMRGGNAPVSGGARLEPLGSLLARWCPSAPLLEGSQTRMNRRRSSATIAEQKVASRG